MNKFDVQRETTKKYILPLVGDISSLLEIGCGIGGNLSVFNNCTKVVGIDLSISKCKAARERTGRIIINNDVFNINNIGKFDLIILKDTIEHIKDKEKLLNHIRIFMTDTSKIFISFPSWYSPFAGHQQCCKSLLRFIPYVHLLPFYEYLLRLFKEHKEFLEVKDQRITAKEFEAMLIDYRIEYYQPYIISPSYAHWVKPVKLPRVLIFLRDYLTTTHYYLINLK